VPQAPAVQTCESGGAPAAVLWPTARTRRRYIAARANLPLYISPLRGGGRYTKKANLLRRSRHTIQVPSTPALAPPSRKAHRAPTNTSALFTFWLARNARAYTSARSIGFCAIWVCISSSFSATVPSKPDILTLPRCTSAESFSSCCDNVAALALASCNEQEASCSKLKAQEVGETTQLSRSGNTRARHLHFLFPVKNCHTGFLKFFQSSAPLFSRMPPTSKLLLRA
jgi:hypothetical protein